MHPGVASHLVPALFELYKDVEYTDRGNQFYEKFSMRTNISELLEWLWTIPAHLETWRAIGVSLVRLQPWPGRYRACVGRPALARAACSRPVATLARGCVHCVCLMCTERSPCPRSRVLAMHPHRLRAASRQGQGTMVLGYDLLRDGVVRVEAPVSLCSRCVVCPGLRCC